MHEAPRPAAPADVRAVPPRPKRGGYPHTGLRFYVWDEDAWSAAAWAAQLADVEQGVEARQPAPPTL
jgi:hypothetical protein